MPFDGSGNFTRVHDFTEDRDNGIKILATRMDAEFDNFATGMNQVFFRNGLVAMSGNLAMGLNSITGLADGSAASPALRFTSDATTGPYLSAAHKYAIATGSAKRLEIGDASVDVTGALNVSGAASPASLAVTNNATVGGTLGVTGLSTLASLGVTNNATVGGTLGVTGATTLGTTTINSLGVTVNTTIGGTLGVTGLSTLASLGVTNNATVGGTLGVTGAATLGSTLGVTGATTLAGLTAGAAALASLTLTTPLAVAQGGIGANSAAGGRTALGLVIGTDVAAIGSPTFTGVPAAPTAAFGTNTTQLATTAFVDRLRGIPSSTAGAATPTAAARGTCIKATGAQLFNAAVFAADDVVTVYADQAGTVTLTQGAGVTMRLNGTATTGSRTLAGRGFATVYWLSASECVVSGNVT